MTDDKNIVKTELVLKVKNDRGSSTDDNVQTELEKIRSTSISALKILTIAAIIDDDASADFFSDFENYSIIVEKIKSLKLADENLPSDEEKFFKNPIDCWMKSIAILFISLYSLPDNGDIECDVITSTSTKIDDEKTSKPFRGVGVCFNTDVKLESYDWNVHKISLFIPNDSNSKMLFLVDEEPQLFSIV